MLVDLGIFAAVCCIVGAAVLAIYERRRDVLHGPCIKKKPWYEKRRA
jgi:hypothetical protein